MATPRARRTVLEGIIEHDALMRILIEEMKLHQNDGGIPEEELFEEVRKHLSKSKRSISKDLSDMQSANLVKRKTPNSESESRKLVLHPEAAEIFSLADDIAS